MKFYKYMYILFSSHVVYDFKHFWVFIFLTVPENEIFNGGYKILVHKDKPGKIVTALKGTIRLQEREMPLD